MLSGYSLRAQDPLDKLAGCDTVESCREIVVALLKTVRLREEQVSTLEKENKTLEKAKVESDGKLAVFGDKLDSLERSTITRIDTFEQRSNRRFEILRSTLVHKPSKLVQIIDWTIRGLMVYRVRR